MKGLRKVVSGQRDGKNTSQMQLMKPTQTMEMEEVPQVVLIFSFSALRINCFHRFLYRLVQFNRKATIPMVISILKHLASPAFNSLYSYSSQLQWIWRALQTKNVCLMENPQLTVVQYVYIYSYACILHEIRVNNHKINYGYNKLFS